MNLDLRASWSAHTDWALSFPVPNLCHATGFKVTHWVAVKGFVNSAIGSIAPGAIDSSWGYSYYLWLAKYHHRYIAHCSNIDFSSTRSFVDNQVTQAKGSSAYIEHIRQSCTLEEEISSCSSQHSHTEGLKCKIKIITSVRPQSTVLFSVTQLPWARGSLFTLALAYKSQEELYRVSSKMPMNCWHRCRNNRPPMAGSRRQQNVFVP